MSRPVSQDSPATPPAPSRSTGCIIGLLVLTNLQLLVFTVPAVGLVLAWNRLESRLEAMVTKEKLQLEEEITRRVQSERAKMQRDLTEVIQRERAKMETTVQELLDRDPQAPAKGKRGREPVGSGGNAPPVPKAGRLP